MQKKNTIKTILFFLLALILGEGVMGYGLFWPFLFALDLDGFVYYIGLFVGVFFSIYYSQVLGLMSLYILVVLFLWRTFFESDKVGVFWLVCYSVFVNLIFDFLFGFGFSFFEQVLLVAVCFFVGNEVDRKKTIRVSL